MRKWLKRLGIGAGSLVALILLAVVGVYGFSSSGLRRTYDVTEATLVIPRDSATLERGKHLAVAIGKCVECHGPDLAGVQLFSDPAFGQLTSSNLTKGKGGIGGTYTDADFVKALRHGVRPDGTPLMIMPSQAYTHMNDADLAAVIAFVQSMPPVDKVREPKRLGPLARTLYVAKKLPVFPAEFIDHKPFVREVVPPGPTAEYGKYISRIGGCHDCHGENLAGGPVPGAAPGDPPSRNLTPTGIGSWKYEDLKRALREGTRPDGTKLSPTMPYAFTAQMTDEEIQATWAYLQTIPAASPPPVR